MKICRICKELKEIDFFEKSSNNKTTNRCKECKNKSTRDGYRKKMSNPDNKEKERIRGREKYKRLGQKKKSYSVNKKALSNWKEKYPEKSIASQKSRDVPKKNKSNHNHHWSYNKEHWKDVIEITPKLHNLIHRLMDYDQDSKMYISSLSGELLDTKEKHLSFIRLSKFRFIDEF